MQHLVPAAAYLKRKEGGSRKGTLLRNLYSLKYLTKGCENCQWFSNHILVIASNPHFAQCTGESFGATLVSLCLFVVFVLEAVGHSAQKMLLIPGKTPVLAAFRTSFWSGRSATVSWGEPLVGPVFPPSFKLNQRIGQLLLLDWLLVFLVCAVCTVQEAEFIPIVNLLNELPGRHLRYSGMPRSVDGKDSPVPLRSVRDTKSFLLLYS